MVPSSRRSRAPGRPAFALEAHPCEQQLIAKYLGPRVTPPPGYTPCKFIHEGDVYAAHPEDLTQQYAAAVSSNGDEAWYFFTAVRAKAGGRRTRTVDSQEGCWHSEAGSKPVVSADHHGGGLLGHRQNFSFVTKEDGVRVRTGWLMVELGLHGDGQDKFTLCKVYFSPRAAKNNKKTAASSSTRKRKADADSPAPARQCRRRREMNQDDHSVEKEDVKAGKQEGLVDENSPDETEVEDPYDFFWWLRNKDKVRLALGISKEDFYGPPSAAAMERTFGPDWPPAAAPSSPVVPSKDEPVVMWLTYEELYNLPVVREFLSPTKRLEEMRSSVKQHE